MNNILMCEYTIFVYYSSVNRHSDCFSFGDIMNNVAMNIVMQISHGYMFSILLGITLGMELLGHKVILSLTF